MDQPRDLFSALAQRRHADLRHTNSEVISRREIAKTPPSPQIFSASPSRLELDLAWPAGSYGEQFPLSITRSSFPCTVLSRSAISSRNRVPPWAASDIPSLSLVAPEKAPLRAPKAGALAMPFRNGPHS